MSNSVAADAAGRYDELVRVSTQESIPPEFAALYQRILSSRSEREAMARAVEAMVKLLHPSTLTVTKRNEWGRFVLVDNYLDGKRWDYRIGEEPPEYSLTYAIEGTGKVTYRDAALAERKETGSVTIRRDYRLRYCNAASSRAHGKRAPRQAEN